MNRRIVRVAALAFALLGLLAACRQQTTTEPKQPTEIKTDKGVVGNTIKLGELTPLTGPAAIIGIPLTKGHEVYFKYVNETLGGVGKDLAADKKYKVELITKDDQYPSAEVHVQQYNAIKDDVLMIAQSLGTPTTKAILPQINTDKILTGAATLSSEWTKEKYIFAAGAPYAAQYINAAQYLKDQGVTPKAGIIYQDDDYGQEGIKGLEFAAKEFKFEIVARAAHKATDQDFTAQVTAMKNAGADHVFLTATPSPTGKIMGTAATLKYSPRWIGQSPTWIGALAKSPVTPYMQQTYWWVSDASCEWGDTSAGCEGMKELTDNLQKFAPDQAPDIYYVFGYTQARIAHQILEKAVERGDLTREGVVKAFESLKSVNMGGLLNPISYGSKCEDKIPVTASSIYTVDPAKPTGLARFVKQVDSKSISKFEFC
ncbi:MAG: ABC transporter substrate-binding protein [Acidimicrobiia bacterium]